ncbi:hypothetical protein [Streptomyces sp. NPDC014734]|uniref:hypothetical protein n=1 Tax=Streptomyces sp. NPDC014734 TaxID=3364886 RepID=UPI0036FEB8B6
MRNLLGFTVASAVSLVSHTGIATAGALEHCAPPSAGIFAYCKPPDGPVHIIDHPKEGTCHQIDPGFVGWVFNETDFDAVLYPATNCKGNARHTIYSHGDSRPWEITFRSVKFVS